MGISEEMFLSYCRELHQELKKIVEEESNKEKERAEQSINYMAHCFVDDSNGILIGDSYQESFTKIFEKARGIIKYDTLLSHYNGQIRHANNNEELYELSKLIQMTYEILKGYYKSTYTITSNILNTKENENTK